MKTWLIKAVAVCIIAVICGCIGGLLFSLYFYGFVPRHMLADVLESDTEAKMKLRFWIAFAVSAIPGLAWAYRILRDVQ